MNNKPHSSVPPTQRHYRADLIPDPSADLSLQSSPVPWTTATSRAGGPAAGHTEIGLYTASERSIPLLAETRSAAMDVPAEEAQQ
jgi:hypothetical protein